MDFNTSTLPSTIFNQTRNETEKYDASKQIFIYSAGYLCITLFVAVLAREYLKRLPFPHTVVLFVFGAILGILDDNIVAFRNFTRLAKSDVVMQLFLPVIIFDYSFGMNPHMFTMAIGQCITLALPGFILCSGLSAVFAKVVLTFYNWDWIVCILFGTILTATDPSAAIEIFKDYGVAASLITIIQGEAVLNSGIALVAAKTIRQSFGETTLSYEDIILYIFQCCFGAIAFGYVVAMVIIAIFRRTENDMDIEVTLTFCTVYIVYFVSEIYLNLSGILAVVVLGISISSYKSSMNYEKDETTIHQFWQTLSFWANSLIFTTVGVLITSKAITNFDSSDIGFIIASYFVICVFRSCTIAVLTPLLKNCGYGFSWKSGVAVSWGGMRGAIGLALVLLTWKTRPEDIMNKLLIQISGVIILTLVFNASTMYRLLQFLGFGQITEKNIESMARTVALLRDASHTTENVIRMDEYFTGVDWPWIKTVTHIENPYEDKGSVHSAMMKRAFETFRGQCVNCNAEIRVEPKPEERKQMESESSSLVLRALKTSVANQHESYGILRRTLGHLNTCIEYAQESHRRLLAKDVQKYFLTISSYIAFVKRYMLSVLFILDTRERKSIIQQLVSMQGNVNSRFRSQCLKLYFSRRFKHFMFWILVMNLIPIVGEYFVIFVTHRFSSTTENLGDQFLAFEILNGVCTLFYIWDTVIKIVTLGVEKYFRNKGHLIDFIVTVTAVSQIIYGIIVVSAIRYTFTRHHLYGFVALSTVRLLLLLKIICRGIFRIVVNEFCSVFYNAFDLAVGFIVAQEEIAKSAHKLIEYEDCVEETRFAAENNVYEMLCYADKIEKEHPYVVCAWRTHRATIYILKNMKEFIEEMIDSYTIDNADAEKLLEEIESKMNETFSLPRYMKAEIGVRNFLGNVPWIKNAEMLDKIMEDLKSESFSENDIIHETSEEQKDVKILHKGIIKVSGINFGDKGDILPNTDTARYFYNTGKFLLFTNSQTLGLQGYLHRKPCVTRVTSMSQSQLFSIPFEKIARLEEQFGNMSFYMWRQIALQIALAVLSEEPTYESWSDEKLKIHLEEGIFPNFDNVVDFDVPSVIADMVLIQGNVLDKENDVRFVGPDYIPHSYRSLMITGDPKRRPRVVMVLLRERKYHARTILGWVKIKDVKHIGLCIVHGMRRMTTYSEKLSNETSKSFIQTLGSLVKPKGSVLLGSDAP